MLSTVLVPVNRAGWPFIALFAVLTMALWWVWMPLGLAGVVLTLWCVYFFRDPARVTPVREGLVISPADGRVLPVVKAAPPPELELGGDPLTRISIFMNVFDVHVNRAPADGTIRKIAYHPGKFFNAALDKASEDNERMSIAMDTPDGRPLAFVQIAGLVARRIKCWAEEGRAVVAGERYGLIRFGSRVDVYLPDGIAPLVIEGQRTLAGETVLADLGSASNTPEGPREGRVS